MCCGSKPLVYGNPSSFAITFVLEKDPDPTPYRYCPEMKESWGRFAIWVKGKNLCKFMFTESKSGHDEQEEYVSWYLLPMLNWFVENWLPLFSEQKPPEASDGDCAYFMGLNFAQKRLWGGFSPERDRKWYEWIKRHALRSCREGGLFPDIYFRGSGERIEISWGENPLPGEPQNFRFLETAAATTVRREEVTKACHAFLMGATEKLLKAVPDSPELIDLRKKIEKISLSSKPDLKWLWNFPSEELFNKVLEKLSKKISSLNLRSDVLPAPVMMFGTLSPQIDESDIEKIIDSLELSTEEETPLCGYDAPSALTAIEGIPYRSGYALAEDFIERYGPSCDADKAYIDIDQIIQYWGITRKDVELEDKNLRGIAFAGQGIAPLILVNLSCAYNNEVTGKRYTLAHEFCHLLCDRQYGQEVGVASGNWAPQFIEKRANAFAGMLLMPREAIEKYIDEENDFSWGTKEFKSLMERLQVGKKALLEHLSNLHFIDADQKERLERELLL